MFLLLQWLRNYLITNRYYVGLFFSLFIAISAVATYKFYIKNYYFVTPSSNELLGLSVIAFLISLYIIYARYFVEQCVISTTQVRNSLFTSITSSNVSSYAKVPYLIALVVGVIALIEAIAGETPLYPKSYGRMALENSILVSVLCCLHLYWLKINLYHNFYNHIITNKLEVAIYTILTIPYIIVIMIFIPGAWDVGDNIAQLIQSMGYPDQAIPQPFYVDVVSQPITWAKLNNAHPVFITMLLRLFHFFPYDGGLYVFKFILIYIPVVYLFSKTFKYNHLVYLIFLYSPVITSAAFITIKDSEASLFMFSSVLILITYIRTKKNFYLVLSIILLTFATYSRHNQITQVIIILIPIIMLILKQNKLMITSKRIIYLLLVLAVLIELPLKLLMNNPNLVVNTQPTSWNDGSTIAYIAFRQNNLNLIPKKYRDKMTPFYDNYLQMKDNPDFYPTDSISYYNHNWSKPINPSWIYMLNSTSYNTELSLNYLGTALKLRVAVFINYLNSYLLVGYSDKESLSKSSGLNVILYSYFKSAQLTSPFADTALFNYIVNGNLFIKYLEIYKYIKYKYILYISLVLFLYSFITLGYKMLPNINTSNKNLSMIYYIGLSNIFLLVPLVLLTPTGMDGRYLAASYPLTCLAMILFLQELPRYILHYNKCITFYIERINNKSATQ